MFDEAAQTASSLWDSASTAVSDAASSASSTASDAWGAVSNGASEAWGAVSNGASDAWGAVSGAFGGGTQDQGPISVPVTPDQEAAAAKFNEDMEKLANDPNHKSPYQQEQDKKAQQEADYQKREAERQAAEPSSQWSAALDKYLKGEGPNPGPKDEYIQKVNRHREAADPHGPFAGMY